MATRLLRTLAAPCLALWSLCATAAGPEDTIWLAEPAAHFTESLPLGNGRLGVMLFGGTRDETLVLNESGMWSGSPQDADRKDAYKTLPEIRRLLFEGKNLEAEQLMDERFTCAGKGTGLGRGANVPYGCYQVLGRLHLTFVGVNPEKKITGYRRELDLGTAIARLSYSQAGVTYSREAFVSHPDQVAVCRLRAEPPGSLSFDLRLDRPERATTSLLGEDQLCLRGQLNDGRDGPDGVRFAAVTRIAECDGTIRSKDGVIQVRNASEVLLLVAAATDLVRFCRNPDLQPEAQAAASLDRAAAMSYGELLARHVADYRSFYDRVSLHLADAEKAVLDQPTPDRLRSFVEGAPDNALAALAFNFGRYLLISSSRPGGMPANLQGIWADQIQTPWNCDWHLNVNVQMNYWHTEVCNLSELHEPLFALIKSLVKPGSHTARAYYDAGGWVAHTITNPWGFTSPGEQASWGSSNTCSAWLCQHLWEHYLFTHDRDFLDQAYPDLKRSAQFYLDTLVEHPETGQLVAAPSSSPENTYINPDGQPAHICIGATFDMQIFRYLFQACVSAAEVLGQDEDLREELSQALRRLPPTRIGSDGRIMEWDKEYKEQDPHHRHVAHLWGLYPGDEIRPETTPELAAAARRSLEVRGDDGTGWGLAMKMGMWARLGDGERAYLLLTHLLRPVRIDGPEQRWHGGAYPNLFSTHPPYQIDGNFGATAAIAEMLLQSSWPAADVGTPRINLLPALPDAWPEGEVSGLVARGGIVVDMTWKDGKLVSATVTSRNSLPLCVCCGEKRINMPTLTEGASITLDGNLIIQSQTSAP